MTPTTPTSASGAFIADVIHDCLSSFQGLDHRDGACCFDREGAVAYLLSEASGLAITLTEETPMTAFWDDSTVEALVRAERLRAVGKGYTPEHDDAHEVGEMLDLIGGRMNRVMDAEPAESVRLLAGVSAMAQALALRVAREHHLPLLGGCHFDDGPCVGKDRCRNHGGIPRAGDMNSEQFRLARNAAIDAHAESERGGLR